MKRFIAGLLLAVCATAAFAQSDYPTRAIRFVVPYPPGGFTDILARIISQNLTKRLGQSVVVDNRGGGGSTIGTGIVAKAAPDGYTLLMVAPDIAINESLYSKLPYNAAKDFAPITLAAYSPMVLVAQPSLKATSVAALIALAKANPGKLNYASGGNGTGAHLAMEEFKSKAGIDMVHIPYKGVGPATVAMLGGEASVMFLQLAVAQPQIQAGKLHALAIASAERSPIMPNLPTVAESGLPGFDVTPWFGVVAPAGTPKEVIKRLNSAITDILRQPDVKAQLTKQGAQPVGDTPEAFAAFINREIPRWAEVVKTSGARIN